LLFQLTKKKNNIRNTHRSSLAPSNFVLSILKWLNHLFLL